jgi:hypothetical protein
MEGGSGVATFYGDGKGTFTAGPSFGTCSFSTGGCLIADINGDGIPDILQGNWTDGSVSIMYGNADGTFQNPATFVVGGNGAACRVADFRGNGQLDIVVAVGYNHISVLANQNGIFPVYVKFDAVGGDVTRLDVADFNGDGKPDIVTLDDYTNTVSILLNNRP